MAEGFIRFTIDDESVIGTAARHGSEITIDEGECTLGMSFDLETMTVTMTDNTTDGDNLNDVQFKIDQHDVSCLTACVLWLMTNVSRARETKASPDRPRLELELF